MRFEAGPAAFEFWGLRLVSVSVATAHLNIINALQRSLLRDLTSSSTAFLSSFSLCRFRPASAGLFFVVCLISRCFSLKRQSRRQA